MPLRIEDYALIGDCETAALVGRDGSIDWLCWPRFDSGACFAALLGDSRHGRWLIAPQTEATGRRRRYREGTLILETEFETGGGAATVIDFMPLRSGNSDLVRIVVGQRGQVPMAMDLTIRFDYGASMPWIVRLDDGALAAVAGPDMAILRTQAPVRVRDHAIVAEFTVGAGEVVSFDLTHGLSHLPPPGAIDTKVALEETEAYWREWSSRCVRLDHWTQPVRRSLITLKALTHRPTGGIVAAPTTSLPERLGGVRNWDYRYCWLRDSAFTLLALLNAGYTDEAAAWRDWLLRAVAGSPAQMQIMYGVAGERRLPEWEVSWLPGYEGAMPVRVGNGAAGQFQLDVYGEVEDVLYQAARRGLGRKPAGWEMGRVVLGHLEKVWEEPDEGIWEVRGPRQHFTHSKVMAWVALDRAVRSAEELRLEGPVDTWRRLRDRIHEDVCRKGYDAERGSFTQAYGSRQLDASLLLIPIVGFLPPEDPRVRGTLAAIERELMVDGLVLRYRSSEVDDGLPPGEGAFLACSFWFADNLILQGRRKEARLLFEKLLDLRNDVGLLSEEYDPRSRRMTGNFPQAFSHVALVNTALNLSRLEGPAEQRSERAAEPEPAAAS